MARVRFFAAAEEAVGADVLTRTEPTLGALRTALVSEFPALGGILPRCAVLVGGARVDDDTSLGSEALVDVLPPFAGG
ncbi:MoaD/ThiS family protein [Microbacterium sp. RU33B]|uniref:MoaD/ThiS family protein n=1 Tax=Microbacterium sp. RU33B TaxID=1907390 RepID=UPI0009648740|nr:MoaD/ThiS family protein [Microbacterium sp. RU33B]SIT68815.1 Molybdopterin converting factor, small subunit [Microbacterium sp. RU33B]